MLPIEIIFNETLYKKKAKEIEDGLNSITLKNKEEIANTAKEKFEISEQDQINKILNDEDLNSYIKTGILTAQKKTINPKKNEFESTINSIMIPEKFEEVIKKYKVKEEMKNKIIKLRKKR
jgi:hypothetical protein